MDRVEVSTVVYLPPEELYDFLVDFPRYTKYSDYLREIRRDGDGSPGTHYDITFAWWKLSYTARSEVTEVEPPNRINWRLVKDIDAQGYWGIEAAPEEAPEGREHASRVRLVIEFAPESADKGAIDLPRFVSMGWLVDKVRSKVRAEAEAIVERIVRDLEGERRDIELVVHEAPDSV